MFQHFPEAESQSILAISHMQLQVLLNMKRTPPPPACDRAHVSCMVLPTQIHLLQDHLGRH